MADSMMRRDKSYVEEQKKRKASANTGWSNYFWAKPTEVTSQDIEELPENKMTDKEWEELYDMIGYNKTEETVAVPTNKPKEVIFLEFSPKFIGKSM